MTTEEKKFIDLGPFFPKKPTATEPPREDSATRGDMATGSSIVGQQAVVPLPKPIERVDDTTTELPGRQT